MASRAPKKSRVKGGRKVTAASRARRGPRSKTMTRFYRATQGGIKNHEAGAKEQEQIKKGKGGDREEQGKGSKEQDSGAGHKEETSTALGQKIKASRGKGQPITAAVRKAMEKQFGADFSRVRIHHDEESAHFCADLGVRAFTWGDDIFFAAGAYDPESAGGKKLLAHELTHTLQPGAHDRIRCYGESASLPPAQYFDAYGKLAQKFLDMIYARDSYKKWAADNPALLIKGADLSEAAKSVYDAAKVKDYNRIIPPEMAIAQALLEGGLKPAANSAQIANPMNVGIYTGNQKTKQAQSLEAIRKDKGDKEARKAGIRSYYALMYDKYMGVYDRPEKMLGYDQFNKHGTTEFKDRFAEAFYYENKMAAQIGLLYMEQNKEMLKGSVGGKKGNDPEDMKRVLTYIKSYDKFPGKRQPKVKYADLVKTDSKGVPTVESLHKAINEIQDKEIFPAESSFSASKQGRAKNMKENAKADYAQQVEARTKGVDGVAGVNGDAIGYLYYHHLLVTNGQIFGKIGEEEKVDAAKIWTDAGSNAQKIGAQFAKDLPGSAATAKAVLDYLSLNSDNLAYYIVINTPLDVLKSCPDDLLNAMYAAMDGGWTTGEEYEAMGKIKVAQGEAKLDKDPKLRVEPTEKSRTEAKALTPSKASAEKIFNDAGGDYTAVGKALTPYFYSNSLMIQEMVNYVSGINSDNMAYAIVSQAPLSALAAADPQVIKILYDALNGGWITYEEYEMMAKLKPYLPDPSVVVGNTPEEKWANTVLKGADVGSKNAEYAKLILEANDLGICGFTNEGSKDNFPSGKGGPYDTFEKIRDGKLIGSGTNSTPQFNPKTTEMPILPVIHSMLKGQVKQWVDGGCKGKITPVKLGSFMVWNSTGDGHKAGEMRTTNHGMKAKAIDINFAEGSGNMDFSKKEAVTYVMNVLKALPVGTYEIGIPFQGEFLDRDDFSKGASSHPNTAADGKKAWTKIVNDDLRNLVSKMYDDGYKMKIMADFNNHLHLAIGAGGASYEKQ